MGSKLPVQEGIFSFKKPWFCGLPIKRVLNRSSGDIESSVNDGEITIS